MRAIIHSELDNIPIENISGILGLHLGEAM